MKKYISIFVILILVFSVISCKNKKKEKSQLEEVTYTVSSKHTKVKFTAYKTTDKVPVQGVFREISIKNAQPNSNPLEALNGIEFGIPVTSIFTKDTVRDGKLKKFFFGILKNTEIMSGVFRIDADKNCSIDLTLNGVTEALPMEYTIKGKTISFKGILELEKWDAMEAVNSINEACKLLHTGPDGVSKTWSEVSIQAATTLQ